MGGGVSSQESIWCFTAYWLFQANLQKPVKGVGPSKALLTPTSPRLSQKPKFVLFFGKPSLRFWKGFVTSLIIHLGLICWFCWILSHYVGAGLANLFWHNILPRHNIDPKCLPYHKPWYNIYLWTISTIAQYLPWYNIHLWTTFALIHY